MVAACFRMDGLLARTFLALRETTLSDSVSFKGIKSVAPKAVSYATGQVGAEAIGFFRTKRDSYGTIGTSPTRTNC